MTAARTSECVLCLFRRSTRLPASRPRRSLHWTPVRRAEDSKSDKANADIIDIAEQGRKSQQTPTEKWKEQYDERQVEAIEAAKKVIGRRFDEGQSIPRADPWSVNYYDNFEKIDPVVDEPVRAPWENLDDGFEMKTDEELDVEFQKFIEKTDQESTEDEPIAMKYIKFLDSQRMTKGRAENELNPRSAMAPTIPSPTKDAPTKKATRGSGAREDPEIEQQKGKSDADATPEMVRLMQMTGYNARELAALRVKVIVAHSVSNQTRLGKVRKSYYLTVAGNRDGLLGIGEGKADEGSSARMQSQARAIRNMQPIKRYENRTIYGTVNGKVSATELELYARPPGMLHETHVIPCANLCQALVSAARP